MREVRIGLLVRLLDLGSSCSFTVTEFVQSNWWKTAQDDTPVRIRVLLGIGFLASRHVQLCCHGLDRFRRSAQAGTVEDVRSTLPTDLLSMLQS